jgi:hypothetical protein
MANKAGGITALEALLNDAKIARNFKLLDNPLITDAATLTRLPRARAAPSYSIY